MANPFNAPWPVPAGFGTAAGERIVGFALAPGGGGYYWTNKGGVANVGGAPFAGSALDPGVMQGGQRTFDERSFTVVPGGYVLRATSGEGYGFGGSGDPRADATRQFFTYNGVPVSTGITGVPDPQVLDQVRRDYGYLGAFLEIPEVGALLVEASLEGWDRDRLFGALQQTQWWKATSETARQFDSQVKLDPATAEQRVVGAMDDVRATAGRLGVTIDDARLRQIATDYVRNGWDAGQLTRALTAEIRFEPGKAPGGQLGATMQQLREIQRAYLVPFSDADLQGWVTRIASGEETAEGFRAVMAGYASSLYPSLTAAIERGETVEQYAAPYRQIAAQELGINAQEVDFLDPKWNRALNQVDPKTGERAAMSLFDWTKTVRSDSTYGFRTSAKGRSVEAQLAERVLADFGRR